MSITSKLQQHALQLEHVTSVGGIFFTSIILNVHEFNYC
jgi:hypothetical protein